MYPIVRKETLADNIILMDIKAPRVANECLPGQFIIAKTDEVGAVSYTHLTLPTTSRV